MKEDIKFLKELQATLKHESEHDYDFQASPRFWMIVDYRTVPGHEDYDDGEYQYIFNDGDHVIFNTFSEMKEFAEDHCDGESLQNLNNADIDGFDKLWEYIEDNLNEDGYFNKVFVKTEEYIAPNTMFLTKEEAKRHLELNHYHYSSKAHTYAMTAWRAPKVERLIKILTEFDWDTTSEDKSNLQKQPQMEVSDKLDSEGVDIDEDHA